MNGEYIDLIVRGMIWEEGERHVPIASARNAVKYDATLKNIRAVNNQTTKQQGRQLLQTSKHVSEW